MDRQRPLLNRVEDFLAENNMAATTLGRLIAHDPRLILDMRRGRAPGPRLRTRLEHFMNIAKETCQ